MPFKSQAQRAFMHIHHPQIASRWEHEGSTPKRLPKHVSSSKTKKRERISPVRPRRKR